MAHEGRSRRPTAAKRNDSIAPHRDVRGTSLCQNNIPAMSAPRTMTLPGTPREARSGAAAFEAAVRADKDAELRGGKLRHVIISGTDASVSIGAVMMK